jgi:hypothetical protein
VRTGGDPHANTRRLHRSRSWCIDSNIPSCSAWLDRLCIATRRRVSKRRAWASLGGGFLNIRVEISSRMANYGSGQ